MNSSIIEEEEQEPPGGCVKGIRVARAFLPKVHLHEAHAKAVEATQQVQQPSLCHDAPSALPQAPGPPGLSRDPSAVTAEGA